MSFRSDLNVNLQFHKKVNRLLEMYYSCKMLFYFFFLVLARKITFIMFVSAGDETQVNLAVVQASCKDSGVYKCTITNDYGTVSTDCLLSAESMYSFTLH